MDNKWQSTWYLYISHKLLMVAVLEYIMSAKATTMCCKSFILVAYFSCWQMHDIPQIWQTELKFPVSLVLVSKHAFVWCTSRVMAVGDKRVLFVDRKWQNTARRCVNSQWIGTFRVQICDCTYQRVAVDNVRWHAEFSAWCVGGSRRRQAFTVILHCNSLINIQESTKLVAQLTSKEMDWQQWCAFNRI